MLGINWTLFLGDSIDPTCLFREGECGRFASRSLRPTLFLTYLDNN
jgi:hypothetical protein